MSKAGSLASNLLIIAVVFATAGCGRSSAPSSSASDASNEASRPAAVDAPAPVKPVTTSAEVCQLLSAGEVQAILGASPNATPQADTPAGGVSQSSCIWDAGGSRGDLKLTVLQADGGTNALILNSMPMEGDAVSGLGDQAGVTVQGNYNVEVMVRIGGRVMTLEASALGVAEKKDAVVAAARSAAAQLR